MDTSRTLQPGSMLFNGHYRIVSVLGRGGFGITYLAVVENLDKQVAIKEFFPQGMYNRDDVSGYVSVSNSDNDVLVTKLKAKFIKEARRLASLSHDSIVAVSNAFEENGTAYYVMDFIDGRDLQRIVRNNGPLPVDVAVGYIRQVGSALDYLHSLRINHLDVKPANILVDTAHNRAILIDFGLSKQYDSDDRQTSTTPVGVSHGYAPGEQYVPGGVKHFSAPTDVYSLAATLYFMLVGERPPSANELTEQPLVFPAGIPYYIQTAISKAMRNARSDRYPTVAAFLAALHPGVSTLVENTNRLEKVLKKTDIGSNVVEIEGETTKNQSWKWLIFLLIILIMIAAVAVIYLATPRGGSEDKIIQDSIKNSISKTFVDKECVDKECDSIKTNNSAAKTVTVEYVIDAINNANSLEDFSTTCERYREFCNKLPKTDQERLERISNIKYNELFDELIDAINNANSLEDFNAICETHREIFKKLLKTDQERLEHIADIKYNELFDELIDAINNANSLKDLNTICEIHREIFKKLSKTDQERLERIEFAKRIELRQIEN